MFEKKKTAEKKKTVRKGWSFAFVLEKKKVCFEQQKGTNVLFYTETTDPFVCYTFCAKQHSSRS